MQSSYALNRYDSVFRSIVSAYQPITCVELGTLEGYSAVAIGKGLKENHKKYGIPGKLICYDLFEDYPYRNAPVELTRINIEKEELHDFVILCKWDAYKAHEFHKPESVYLLHVDLSNDGDTVDKIMESWDPLMVRGGVILFEGGSEERDQIDWMVKYNRPSIKKALETNKIIEDKYVFSTYFKFPSLSCLLKKR